MMYYSDKRDIRTLEYKIDDYFMNMLFINDLYQKVHQHLFSILYKVDCLDFDEKTLLVMTNTYWEKALDTFIKGLNRDISLLSIKY